MKTSALRKAAKRKNNSTNYNPKIKTKTKGDKTIKKTKSKKDGIVTKTKKTYKKGKLVNEKIKQRKTLGKAISDISSNREKMLDSKLKREITKAKIRQAKNLKTTPPTNTEGEKRKSTQKYFS